MANYTLDPLYRGKVVHSNMTLTRSVGFKLDIKDWARLDRLARKLKVSKVAIIRELTLSRLEEEEQNEK